MESVTLTNELTARWTRGSVVDCAFMEVDGPKDTVVIRQQRSAKFDDVDPPVDDGPPRVRFHVCDLQGRWTGAAVEIERSVRGPVLWSIDARELLAKAGIAEPFAGVLYAVEPQARHSGLMIVYRGARKFGYYLGGISDGSYVSFNESRSSEDRRFQMMAPKVWLKDGWRTRIIFINASTDPAYAVSPWLQLELLPPNGESPMSAEVGPVPPFAAAVVDVDEVFGPEARARLKTFDGCASIVATTMDSAVFVTFSITESVREGSIMVEHTRPLKKLGYVTTGIPEPRIRDIARAAVRRLLVRGKSWL